MNKLKLIVEKFYTEVFNQQNELLAYEILTPDFTVHALPPLEKMVGIPLFIGRIRDFHQAFPDIQYTVMDQIAEQNKVATRFLASGTHKGSFLGVEATNKEVSWSGIAIHWFNKDRISQNWVNADFLGLVKALKYPASGTKNTPDK